MTEIYLYMSYFFWRVIQILWKKPLSSKGPWTKVQGWGLETRSQIRFIFLMDNEQLVSRCKGHNGWWQTWWSFRCWTVKHCNFFCFTDRLNTLFEQSFFHSWLVRWFRQIEACYSRSFRKLLVVLWIGLRSLSTPQHIVRVSMCA